MKLYEISKEFEELDKTISEIDSPEAAEEYQKKYESIRMQFDEKAENTAKYIKNLQAEAEMLQAEEERLYNRRHALENKAESIKNYLKFEMEKNHIDKLKTILFNFSIQKNPESLPKDINIENLGEEFIKIKKEADKEKIKEFLKLGGKLENIELISRGTNLRII